MTWGAVFTAPGRAAFGLWAPAARRVTLEIDGRPPVEMAQREDGWCEAETGARPGDRYRYRIDGGMAVPDPASRLQADGVHGWSVLTDPGGYRWRTESWRGRPWREAVIYELHAGLLGGFAGVAADLPRLAALGVTAVELMPVNAFSGTRNWGYDGVLPYAPAAAYGTPDELKALVDRAHELGLMMILDVVYNHFGPDGNYLGVYAPEFFDADVHTPWGSAIAFERAPVRRFLIDNALMWLEEFRFDGLRFDAVHAIPDKPFIDDLGREIRETVDNGRHVHLILENDDNEAAPLEACYDAQWNDDFHHVSHVLLTGETAAYYRDYAEAPAAKLARCLEQGFIYQGQASPHRNGQARGTPSGHLPPTAFVSFLQNHDQVGNRAMGERLTVLADADRLRAATALLLLSPHIPLLFMGEETGSRTPFLFFTDFHDELADAVRDGRRREFARFPAFADPEARTRIPDPNDRATFERSRPAPGPDGDAWTAFYAALIDLRRRDIVPRLDGASSLGAEPAGEGGVAARWRLGDGAALTLAANLGAVPVSLPELPVAPPLFALLELGAPGCFAAWVT